jgi:hypothetical protein
MVINNPNRNFSNSASSLPAPAAAPSSQQQLQTALKSALERIHALEQQMQTLLHCIYVDGSGNVEISSTKKISLIAGTEVVIQASMLAKIESTGGAKIEVSSSQVKLQSPSQIRINSSTISCAASMAEWSAGMVSCSGTVKCDTIIANSVVGSSYTPGAGNIW